MLFFVIAFLFICNLLPSLQCYILYWFVIILSLFSVKVGGKRVPLPKHHEEKAEAPKIIEVSEEKEK